jgi:hypothetical protein
MKLRRKLFIFYEKKFPSATMRLNFAEGVTDINYNIMSLIRPRKSPIISNSFMELEQRCYSVFQGFRQLLHLPMVVQF